MVTDTLSLAACGWIIWTVMNRNKVVAVRYRSVSSAGGWVAQLLARWGLIPRPAVIDANLTKSLPNGEPLYDRLQLVVTEFGELVRDAMTRSPLLLDTWGEAIDPDRKQAFLVKNARRQSYDAIALALGTLAEHGADVKVRLRVAVSDVAPFVERILREWMDVRVSGYRIGSNSDVTRILWGGANLTKVLLGSLVETARTRGRPQHPPTVASQFARNLGSGQFHTDDLWWYRHSGLPPDRCLVFFDRSRSPATDEVLTDIGNRGHRVRIVERGANRSSKTNTHGYGTDHPRRILNDLMLIGRMVRRARRAVCPRWQLSVALQGLIHTRNWQRFIEAENIKVILSVEESGFDAMSLAADLTGAVRIGFHWSDLFPVYGLIMRLHQVYFSWGPKARNVVRDARAGCCEYVLESGCINDDTDLIAECSAKALKCRAELLGRGLQHVVAVFDRSLGTRSYYGLERHVQFYDAMFDWAERTPNVGLIIKTKGDDTPRACQRVPRLQHRLEKFLASGRGILLDLSHHIFEASIAADVTLALGSNSAGFVAGAQGARVLFLDSARSSLGPFSQWYSRYGWETGRIVFLNAGDLYKGAEELLSHAPGSSHIGDMTGEKALLDPFRDGKATHRFAHFIRSFVDASDRGQPRSEALEEAVDAYSQLWGFDRVFRRSQVFEQSAVDF